MTREEAIEILKNTLAYESDFAEAKQMAIEALEQEPNEDLISRKDAIDEMGYCQTYLFDTRDKDKKISLEDALYALEQLSSAEPKRGEWQKFNYSDGDVMECTNCGYRDWRDRWLEDEVHNYCPNCGARMESDEQ